MVYLESTTGHSLSMTDLSIYKWEALILERPS